MHRDAKAAILVMVVMLVFTFAVSSFVGYIAVKAMRDIEKNGLRHYIERVWEGQQVGS